MTDRRHQERVAKVAALLFPRNIAIVGASDRKGNWSLRLFEALRRFNFPGTILPVNPNYQSVWGGERCYARLADLPEKPDHVAILVPREAAIDALREAGKAGARSATIFSSGFGEGGDPGGRALGARLAAVVTETGIALSGPNCMGNLSGPHRMLTLFDDRITTLAPGPVAIFGQSGGIVMALHRTLVSRGVEPGYAVTSGNEIGLNSADYIRFFADDPKIRVIAGFIESVKDIDDFLAACAYARDAGKPVVVLKLGASEGSRAAALAHTGSLAGALDCFEAVTGGAGLIRMNSLDEIIETVEYFAHAAAPTGRRLGAITFSGGLKALLTEAAERSGLAFPALAPATVARLKQIVGVGTSIGNPLDAGFTALSSSEAYLNCIDALLADPDIDVLLLQEELPRAEAMNAKVGNLREVNRRIAAGGTKPVAVVSMVSYMLTDEGRRFRREVPHLPFLHEPNKALKAVGAAGSFGALCKIPPVPLPSTGAAPPAVGAILARARPVSQGKLILDEADAKALLRAYGLGTPAEAVARSAEEAVAAAERIGYPVVLKILSHEILHKSDVGGVVLGLDSAATVRAAYARLAALPGKSHDAVLVARQVTGAVELVLGVHRDPETGPVIMFGGGGTLIELYRDVAFGPVPLSAAEAEAMIARTRAGRILAGYRETSPRDRDAVLAALVSLGRLAHDLRDRIESVDINPFAAMAEGEGGYCLDALVVLRPDETGVGAIASSS